MTWFIPVLLGVVMLKKNCSDLFEQKNCSDFFKQKSVQISLNKDQFRFLQQGE